MGNMSFQSGQSNPCRFRPAPKEDASIRFLLDLGRTVAGVAIGTLIALAVARQVVVSEMKDAARRMEREMRSER